MRIQLMFVLLLGAVACSAPVKGRSAQQAPGTDDGQLDTRIGPPAVEKYEAIRDAKDWLNPYLSVCPQGVILSVRSVRREAQTVSIEELAQTLRELPTLGWPYGRIVALQDCSIGIPGDEEESRRRMLEVQAVLKTLKLEVSLWPS